MQPLATPSGSARDEPSLIAGFARAIARALEHKGVDSSRAFRAAGLPQAVSNAPSDRLTASQLNSLYGVCLDMTRDPYFGLTVGRFIHVSNFHALGYALMASRTLMDFCLRLERYFPILSQAAVLRVERQDGHVALRSQPRIALSGQTEDAFFAFMLRFMRMLYGKPVIPLRIEKRHACPAEGPLPYVEEFGIAPGFGAAGGALVFAADQFDEPLYGACPDLAEYNDRIAAQCLARLCRSDVVARVRAAILERVATGECTRHEVARALGVGQASLQAKLAERGASFNGLLDGTRRELALGYLAQHHRSITEISFLLGFTDASNFTRAFRRWTGVSPTRYRVGLTAE